MTAAVYALYDVLQFPDTGILLINITLTSHPTQNCIFYNDAAPLTDSNKGAWGGTGVSFLELAGLTNLAAEGDADT